MFPVRCYTCNAVLGHRASGYRRHVTQGGTPLAFFEALEMRRMCCRRMFLGHVDVVDDMMAFPNKDLVLDAGQTQLRRHAPGVRDVPCD